MLSRIWYQIGRGVVFLYAQLLLQMDIHRKAPLPQGPAILVANHPSLIDPAILTILGPAQMRILILDTLFKVPMFGRSLRWSGHIPVVCGSGQAALEAAQASLKAGRTVVVFPEGVISPTGGGFHRPHTGMARLALSMGVPVIPVGISLDPAQIRRIHTHVDGKPEVATWYFHGPYAITVGEPLLFSGDAENRECVSRVTEQIMQRIHLLSYESSQRILAREARLNPAFVVWRAAWQFAHRSLNAVTGLRLG
jgi:1-acyl-sn-glycerol-3-phosphate acyltransferase